MDIVNFKKECINASSDTIVKKHIIEGPSFFFNNVKIGEEFKFKRDIADILNVHIRDIVIVGSGKLGFSLKPANAETGLYLYREFDYEITNQISQKKSDLDVAIISSYLFDKEIKNLYNHTEYYKNLWATRTSFAKYALKGKLPIRFLPLDFSMTKEVIKVQEKYQMEYGREVNIEVYKSWHFFETYHQENIKNIQVNLIA
jgi:hypothetical protein